jgi:alkylation response protein AidB-like acyl-CoA dehydrogenase
MGRMTREPRTSTTTTTTTTTAVEPPPADDSALPIDTSAMPEGQRAALEVAESARDHADPRDSFAGRLLMGRFEPSFIMPFPRSSDADRAVGDDLVARVSTLLAERLDPEEVDHTRTIPEAVIDGLRELGVFRMKVPVEHGGLGLSQVNYNRVVQAIASYCGSTAVLVSAHQSIGVPQPLKMFGTDEQKERFLPRISRGALSAFALTEPGVGSDPAQMKTTATPTDDGEAYVLNGEKLWTTNGPVAELLVVMASTPPRVCRGRERRQISAFIVETDTPGVEVTHRCDFMGLRAIQNGVIRFRDVRVPAENLLWGEGLGLKLALRTLNTGRLTLPAACAGIGKQCLAIARSWGAERVQWGRAIGRHEAGAAKIATIASTTFAMEAVAWLTSHWADAGKDIRIEAGMAKLFTSEAAWRLVDMTMQLRGGRGYERASSLRARGETGWPVERMMRDARINTIIEGTSEIMRLFLAREALDPHLRLAADLMRPGADAGTRLRGAARVARFYAGWYPARLLRTQVTGRAPWRHRSAGRLARHLRFIDRGASRLAAALFHAMGRHQARLERRQVLLGHLMDIGTELFAMSAACAYALSGLPTAPEAERIQLADHFCREARRRIAAHHRAARRHDHRPAAAVARRALEGGFRWLESGIIAAAPSPATPSTIDLGDDRPSTNGKAARTNGRI